MPVGHIEANFFSNLLLKCDQSYLVFFCVKYSLMGVFSRCREIHKMQKNRTIVCNQTIPFNLEGKTHFYLSSRISQEILDSSLHKLRGKERIAAWFFQSPPKKY